MLMKTEKGGNEKLSLKVVVYVFLGFLYLPNDVTNDDVISRVVYKQTDERKMLWMNLIFICNICVFVIFLPSLNANRQ